MIIFGLNWRARQSRAPWMEQGQITDPEGPRKLMGREGGARGTRWRRVRGAREPPGGLANDTARTAPGSAGDPDLLQGALAHGAEGAGLEEGHVGGGEGQGPAPAPLAIEGAGAGVVEEDPALLGAEGHPAEGEVDRAVAGAEVAEIDDGSHRAILVEDVAGVEVAVEPDPIGGGGEPAEPGPVILETSAQRTQGDEIPFEAGGALLEGDRAGVVPGGVGRSRVVQRGEEGAHRDGGGAVQGAIVDALAGVEAAEGPGVAEALRGLAAVDQRGDGDRERRELAWPNL